MIRFDFLERQGLSVAAFSERCDGDCAWRPDPACSEGRKRCCLACGIEVGDLVCAEQVHSTRVARVGMQERGRGAIRRNTALPGADALVTNVPGLPLAVFAADCVPLFLFDPARRAAALIHAGREGTRQAIASRTLEMLEEEFQSRPEDIYAVIGPGAGPDRYEVSVKLAEAWTRAGLPGKGRFLDLWQANADQLASAGVPRDQIHISRICTIEDPRFFSHRRDKDGRRNMALMML